MSGPFPSAEDLLATVSDFLVALRGDLAGERRYQAQVAAYLLDIVRREIVAGSASASAADLATLQEAIRSGGLDADDALAERILADVAAEVAIVRPDKLDPIHRGDRP